MSVSHTIQSLSLTRTLKCLTLLSYCQCKNDYTKSTLKTDIREKIFTCQIKGDKKHFHSNVQNGIFLVGN